MSSDELRQTKREEATPQKGAPYRRDRGVPIVSLPCKLPTVSFIERTTAHNQLIIFSLTLIQDIFQSPLRLPSEVWNWTSNANLKKKVVLI